ncbi:olfactory receptor 11G2-like [Poecilia latipinna]|uniref:olfactory receptor 11G2-like n=1 Tax=Poecilia latipinna TaxID=48699 RepID=UPI00072E0FEB|nr:PREDICTED: olfactory receptor 11G2-like [Poecilia latipinna]
MYVFQFMDEVNITYITLNGYVEMNRLKYLYFTVMLMVYILIFLCNGTVFYIICFHKNLHEPMYIFIAALLFNSVVYSTTIYPKLLIDFLSEKQIITYSSCIIQLFMFYSVAGTEFFLLAVMAFDRYVSICKPLRYPTIMRKSTVTSLLVLAYFVPACHIAGEAILISKVQLCHSELDGIFCNNGIFTLHCVKSRALTIFGIFSLLNLAMLPVLFTIFTYTKILIISYKSSKAFRRKAAETCVPHLLVLISFSYLSTYDVVIARVESDFPKPARFVMTLQIFLYQPLFNPFIYGLKMKEISKHLKKLLSFSTI